MQTLPAKMRNTIQCLKLDGLGAARRRCGASELAFKNQNAFGDAWKRHISRVLLAPRRRWLTGRRWAATGRRADVSIHNRCH